MNEIVRTGLRSGFWSFIIWAFIYVLIVIHELIVGTATGAGYILLGGLVLSIMFGVLVIPFGMLVKAMMIAFNKDK